MDYKQWLRSYYETQVDPDQELKQVLGWELLGVIERIFTSGRVRKELDLHDGSFIVGPDTILPPGDYSYIVAGETTIIAVPKSLPTLSFSKPGIKLPVPQKPRDSRVWKTKQSFNGSLGAGPLWKPER